MYGIAGIVDNDLQARSWSNALAKTEELREITSDFPHLLVLCIFGRQLVLNAWIYRYHKSRVVAYDRSPNKTFILSNTFTEYIERIREIFKHAF